MKPPSPVFSSGRNGSSLEGTSLPKVPRSSRPLVHSPVQDENSPGCARQHAGDRTQAGRPPASPLLGEAAQVTGETTGGLSATGWTWAGLPAGQGVV